MTTFREGDTVEWSSHGGTARGTVLRKITADTQLAGRVVRASPEGPQYLVRSESGSGEAVHRPDALRKVGART